MTAYPSHGFAYRFEWDPAKARRNRAKHGVGLEAAATLFQNPLAITIYDRYHSESEARWVTLGPASTAIRRVKQTRRRLL